MKARKLDDRLAFKKFRGGKNDITTEPSEYVMHRLTQSASHASAWRRPPARRSTNVANVVEYGLLSMFIISLTSIGATFAGDKLTSVFNTVAMAMQQADTPQNVLAVRTTSSGQRTTRKGAPVERDTSGKLSPLSPL